MNTLRKALLCLTALLVGGCGDALPTFPHTSLAPHELIAVANRGAGTLRTTLAPVIVISILGGHGVWVPPRGQAPSSAAHNLASTQDGSKLYVTHSNGQTKESVFDVASASSAPVFLRQIDVGANPCGMAHFVQ